MRSIILRKAIYVPALALALTSMAPAAVTLKTSGAAVNQNWNFESEASTLLNEVQALSGKLKADTGRLDSLKRQTTLGWQTHAYELTLARGHINAIGERLDRLQAIQTVAAPWQQRAISEIVPVAAGVAAHTEAAIQHLNENRDYLYAPAYTGHLTEIAQRSDELKSTVDAYLEFASTSEKQQKLERKLDQIRDTLGLIES